MFVSVVLGLLRLMRAFQLMMIRHFFEPDLLSWALRVEGGPLNARKWCGAMSAAIPKVIASCLSYWIVFSHICTHGRLSRRASNIIQKATAFPRLF
jgi:hypothetical protein